MSNDYKTFKELKEELGNNYDLFMYEINLCLLQKIDKAIEHCKSNMFVDSRFMYEQLEILGYSEDLETLGDKDNE